LLHLIDPGDITVSECLRYRLTAMPINHQQFCGAKFSRGVDDMAEQWTACKRVQNLRAGGVHARTFSGRQYNDVQFGYHELYRL